MTKRKPRARSFAGARIALWIATLALAGFGAIGWGLALWPVSQPLAIIGGIVALVAPLAAAALTGPAAHGAGLSAWLAIIIFTAMDAGSNANAIWEFDEAANASINRPAQEAYEADLAAAKATLAAANAALLALPTPDAEGPIRKADTYTTTHTALSGNVKTAQDALDALKKPEVSTLFPKWLSGSVMALTSLALIFGHLAVNTAARKAQEAFNASAPPVKAKRRKRRQSPVKAQEPAKAPEPADNVHDLWGKHRGKLN
jgi:hypothetical protein